MGKYKAPELYSSCDILLHNWEQMGMTNDFLWLLKDQTFRDKPKELPGEIQIELAYFGLYDEYAQLTGLHEKLDRWRELMVLRMDARVEVAEGNKAAKNRIAIYTEQIKNIMKSDGDNNVMEHRMAIQQMYGIPINPHTTTLREFLSISNLVERQNKPKATDGTD